MESIRWCQAKRILIELNGPARQDHGTPIQKTQVEIYTTYATRTKTGGRKQDHAMKKLGTRRPRYFVQDRNWYREQSKDTDRQSEAYGQIDRFIDRQAQTDRARQEHRRRGIDGGGQRNREIER